MLENTDNYVQDLNDRFTDPSGRPTPEISATPDDAIDPPEVLDETAPAAVRAGSSD